MTMKCKDATHLESFIKDFEEVVRQLKVTGAELDDKDLVCTLLLAMPQSLETVITILENMNPDDLTFDLAKAKLRAEVERKKAVNDDKTSVDQKENVKPAAFSVKVGVCYRCGEKGHIRKNCFKEINQRGDGQSGSRDKYQGNNRGYRGSGSSFRGSTNNFRGSSSAFRGSSNTFRGTNNFSRGRPGNTNYNRRGDDLRGNYVEKEDDNVDKSVCFMTEFYVNQDENVSKRKEIVFFIDSGCTDHLVNEKDCFSDFMILKEPIRIAVAKSDNYIEATGIGNIRALSDVNGTQVKCNIKNVFYVPNLRKNLLSVRRLEIENIKIIFNDGEVSLYSENNLVGIGKRNTLYEIRFQVDYSECLNTETENENLKLWHKRLGHICNENLNKLIKNDMVKGIDDLKVNRIDFCESCVQGKMTRLGFESRIKAKRILEIVHSDVLGPITPLSHNDERYCVTFIDDYSNFIQVYMIKNKSDVYNCFRDYVNEVQAKFGTRVSKLRCDDGGEYVLNELKIFARTTAR